MAGNFQGLGNLIEHSKLDGICNASWGPRPLRTSPQAAVEVAMSQRLTIIRGPTGMRKTTCVAAYVWNIVKKHPNSNVLKEFTRSNM